MESFLILFIEAVGRLEEREAKVFMADLIRQYASAHKSYIATQTGATEEELMGMLREAEIPAVKVYPVVSPKPYYAFPNMPCLVCGKKPGECPGH